MNVSIQEDLEFPKDPSHFDLKYIKTQEGPLLSNK